MKNIKFSNKSVLWLSLVLAITAIGFSSCTKMDDYKKFTEGGEIPYTGKLDSIRVLSGRSRVVVNGLFLSDPKVTTCKIYWNNMKDSVVIPVVRKNVVDTLSFSIPNLSEGIQNFTIYTIDNLGNKSIPVYKTGRVYADRYQSSLQPRTVSEARTDETTGITTVNFLDMDRLTGVFGTDITYTKINNQSVTIRIPIDSTKIALPDFKYGSTINYKTLFLPDTISIDTFSSVSTAREIPAPAFIKINVTSTYLKNTGANMARSSWDNSRWGVLADWTSSAGAKNISNNTYGGYEFRNGAGVISFEAGWGLPALNNGLIYQTITLSAGTYSFEANMVDQNAGGTRYIAVAEGTSLPSVTNIPSTAIGYVVLNAAPIVLNGSVKLEFTLTETKQVSIGFAATMADTGQYTKIGNVRLYTVQYL